MIKVNNKKNEKYIKKYRWVFITSTVLLFIMMVPLVFLLQKFLLTTIQEKEQEKDDRLEGFTEDSDIEIEDMEKKMKDRLVDQMKEKKKKEKGAIKIKKASDLVKGMMM